MTAFQELSFFVYNHIKSLVFYINIHYHKPLQAYYGYLKATNTAVMDPDTAKDNMTAAAEQVFRLL